MRRSSWICHVLCVRETSLIELAADEAVRILEENACSAEDVNPAALEGAAFDFCAAAQSDASFMICVALWSGCRLQRLSRGSLEPPCTDIKAHTDCGLAVLRYDAARFRPSFRT